MAEAKREAHAVAVRSILDPISATSMTTVPSNVFVAVALLALCAGVFAGFMLCRFLSSPEKPSPDPRLKYPK